MSVKAPPPGLQRTPLGGPSRVGPTSFGRASIRLQQAQDSRSGRTLIYRFPVRQVGCRSSCSRQMHRGDAARGPLAPGSRMNGLHRAGYRVAFALLRRGGSCGARRRRAPPWRYGRVGGCCWCERPTGPARPAGRWHRARRDPARRLLRELREETGLRAGTAELAAAGSFQFEDNHRQITAHVSPGGPAHCRQPMADQREIVWAAIFSPRAQLAGQPLAALPRLYLWQSSPGAVRCRAAPARSRARSRGSCGRWRTSPCGRC